MLNTKKQKQPAHPLRERKLYVPRMGTGGATILAAALRSLGIDAVVSPPSDERTLELASQFTTGEECLPQRITLGNFLKIITDASFQPEKTAFFMPTSSGPCRFGQYAPFLKKILNELGCSDALVFSPTSSDGYEGIARHVNVFKITAWRAVVVSDILRKLLLMFRPYEENPGDTDRLHHRAVDSVCQILSNPSLSLRNQYRQILGALETVRDQFLHLPLKEERGSRPLIGAVGEIFIRFNSFSNQNIIRKIEALGGEVWLANVSEWIWYTNKEQERKLNEAGKRITLSMFGVKIKSQIQKWNERTLTSPFQSLFKGREDPHIESILENSKPYLPQHMALGEMTLNAGNAIAFYKTGCDGVIDLSPFTCMNGIVTEAVYPIISRDHNHIPIRIFYFDGVPIQLDNDLDIFMDLVQLYHKKNKQFSNKSKTTFA
jgi:predicted nucleotide-binding protein (sugar kinase/HSP70/actin superfamily)